MNDTRSLDIVFIAGPPGSGRLNSLLRIVSDISPGRNVASASEACLSGIPGVAQFPPVEAYDDSGRSMAFCNAVDYALRSNPDVLLMGDVRDRHAADHAWKAALRGVQVWAMVPAGDAMKAFEYLCNEGVELRRLADHTIVNGVVAQRLVRKLCPHCALDAGEAVHFGCQDARRVVELAEALGAAPRFARPGGCDECEDGHSGRTLVAEAIVPDGTFMEYLGDGKRRRAHDHWLTELEGRTMLENAARLVIDGVLDPDEVERRVGLLDEVGANRIPPPSCDGRQAA